MLLNSKSRFLELQGLGQLGEALFLGWEVLQSASLSSQGGGCGGCLVAELHPMFALFFLRLQTSPAASLVRPHKCPGLLI